MPLAEPYQTNLSLIGSRLIAIESRTPGIVRMRINPNPQKVAAASRVRCGSHFPSFTRSRVIAFISG